MLAIYLHSISAYWLAIWRFRFSSWTGYILYYHTHLTYVSRSFSVVVAMKSSARILLSKYRRQNNNLHVLSFQVSLFTGSTWQWCLFLLNSTENTWSWNSLCCSANLFHIFTKLTNDYHITWGQSTLIENQIEFLWLNKLNRHDA